MITEEYINSYRKFVEQEIQLTAQYNGNEYAKRIEPYYRKMYELISKDQSNYIIFKSSSVTYYEMEFAETVEPIREKILELAQKENIPIEILFIPRVKVNGNLWDQIIHKNVERIIRTTFDQTDEEDFKTLRLYEGLDRYHSIIKWSKSKNGKNFLYEFQVSQGIRSEFLIKKRLYLFNREFVRQQMMWMSEKIWVHQVVIEAFKKWEKDKSLWNKIDHVKRKLLTREIFDESRQEIKFLRLLESVSLKKRFIHDTEISWEIKYRPDFWFVQENLIVEYDEIAHKFQIDNDINREKIIRKYLPNVHFIRVSEGNEMEGLKEIQNYLKKFSDE